MKSPRSFTIIGTVFAAAMSATALTPVTAGAADAVLSGTQDLKVAGLTPITLTYWPSSVIWAPSKVIMLRRPLIVRSLAI